MFLFYDIILILHSVFVCFVYIPEGIIEILCIFNTSKWE